MVLPEPKPPNSDARRANAMVSGNPRMVWLMIGISSSVRASSSVLAPMNTPRENATKKYLSIFGSFEPSRYGPIRSATTVPISSSR